jgi:hypothetical protein
MTFYEQIIKKHKDNEPHWILFEDFQNFKVVFRWHPEQGQFRKMKGQEEQPIPFFNELYIQAKGEGKFITEEEYKNFGGPQLTEEQIMQIANSEASKESMEKSRNWLKTPVITTPISLRSKIQAPQQKLQKNIKEKIPNWADETLKGQPMPTCFTCKHMVKGSYACPAFPDGIPQDITLVLDFHKTKFPGQIGDYVYTPKSPDSVPG